MIEITGRIDYANETKVGGVGPFGGRPFVLINIVSGITPKGKIAIEKRLLDSLITMKGLDATKKELKKQIKELQQQEKKVGDSEAAISLITEKRKQLEKQLKMHEKTKEEDVDRLKGQHIKLVIYGEAKEKVA